MDLSDLLWCDESQSEDSMRPSTSSQSPRHSGKDGETAVTSLEHRISELEQLANSQSRELKTQFERIAQLQAEWDILRIRFIKS